MTNGAFPHASWAGTEQRMVINTKKCQLVKSLSKAQTITDGGT